MVKNPNHHLNVSLGLHMPTHDAETHQWLVILRYEARNDGMVWALAAIHTVRMPRLYDKSTAPILHTDSGAGDYDSRSKTHIIRLDERHHHTAFIGSSKVHSAVIRRDRCDRMDGAIHSYFPGAFC